MKKILLFLTIIIFIGLIIVIYLVINNEDINSSEKISNIILSVTCITALITCFTIVYQNLLIKETLNISLEPALLIKIKPGQIEPTEIRYSNPTLNTFYNLNIRCDIEINNFRLEFPTVFERKIFLGPKGQRTRRFNFIEESKIEGYDLIEESKKKKEVILSFFYSYKFSGKLKKFDAQKYILNSERRSWSLY